MVDWKVQTPIFPLKLLAYSWTAVCEEQSKKEISDYMVGFCIFLNRHIDIQ